MNHINLTQAPKPQDFSSFEDYERAIQLYDLFKSREGQLNALMLQKLPQETFDVEMKKLGFFKTSLDDMFGKNAFIVKVILDFQNFQDFCLENFFYGLRPIDEVCLLPEMIENPVEIPFEWLEKGAFENILINQSLNFLEALKLQKSCRVNFQEFLKNSEFQHFGRIWFEWIFENLVLQTSHSELPEEMIRFLESHPSIKNSSETKIFINFLKE